MIPTTEATLPPMETASWLWESDDVPKFSVFAIPEWHARAACRDVDTGIDPSDATGVDQALERAAEGAALCGFGKDLRLSALSNNQGIVALVVLTLVVTILTLVVTILTLVVVAEVVPLVVGVFVLKLGGAAQLVPVRDPVVVRVGTVRAGAKKSGY